MAQRAAEPRHGLRIGVAWLLLSAIFAPLVYFAWGPHMPPGGISNQADGQRFDNQVLGTVATPVLILILVYFIYALIFWRQRGDQIEDGPPIHGHGTISAAWILTTSAIVLALAGFGTYELIHSAGAGSGSGPAPIWKPNGKPLQVQVIAQEWRFTFRYPSYGGMETKQLVLPANTQVQFNVTSLDVIHSFWAYNLGVKADANPDVNNVAYAVPIQTGVFDLRCSELCGMWHGAMFTSGEVMSRPAFQGWARATEARLASVTKLLPKYALVYDPDASGAGGTYYGPQYPVQP